MRTKVVTGLALGFAVTAVASGQGVPQLFDTAGLRNVGVDSLQAHTLQGDLVWGSGFQLDDPGVITAQFGAFDFDGGVFGPFTSSWQGPALRDDFAKDPDAAANSGSELVTFRFVGGVAAAGEQIAVLYLDKDEEVVDGFTVTLPQGGNFIWTINLKGAGIEKPDNGFVQIQHQAGGNVTWFATENLVLGDNQFLPGGADGSEGTTMYSFQMINASLPAPGALALLGLAGLVGARRRRN